jgi:hypothetical protein
MRPSSIKPVRSLISASVLMALAAVAQASSNGLVISQVYGGGGTSGATYKGDFVELFNGGTAAVSLTGLSLQYASASSTGLFSNNSPQALPNVALQAGQYFLIKLEGNNSAGNAALPVTADLNVTGPNISGTAGKLVLVNGTSGLACNGSSTVCSTAQLAQIIDLVGYGSSANYFETSPAPAPSTTTSIVRANGGCTDTGSNAADFSVLTAPAPRNTAST